MKYAKKSVFFQKYLVISKKSSTFAPAFEKEHVFLAQLVEQLTLNQWVQGSSPWEDTKRHPLGCLFFVHIICIIQKNVLILQKIITIQFFLL